MAAEKPFNQLFDYRGRRLTVAPNEQVHLRSLNAAGDAVVIDAVAQVPGRYWLVSRDLEHQAMLAEALVFTTPLKGRTGVHVAYATEGMANYDHFNLPAAIAILNKKNNTLEEPIYNTLVPTTVITFADQLVAYEAGKAPQPVERNSVPLINGPAGLAESLDNQFPQAQILQLFQLLAGRVASIEAFLGLIGLHCERVGLKGKELRTFVQALIRDKHQALACQLLGAE